MFKGHMSFLYMSCKFFFTNQFIKNLCLPINSSSFSKKYFRGFIGRSLLNVLLEKRKKKKKKKKRSVILNGGGITIVSNVQINQLNNLNGKHSKSKDEGNSRAHVAAKLTVYHNCFDS
jgi:hypothetical protein